MTGEDERTDVNLMIFDVVDCIKKHFQLGKITIESGTKHSIIFSDKNLCKIIGHFHIFKQSAICRELRLDKFF